MGDSSLFLFLCFSVSPLMGVAQPSLQRETRRQDKERLSDAPRERTSRHCLRRDHHGNAPGRHRVYACGVSRAVGSSLTVAGSTKHYLCLGALHCGSMRDVCVCVHVCKYLCPAEQCMLAMLSVGLSVSSRYHRLEKEPVLLCVSIKPLLLGEMTTFR